MTYLIYASKGPRKIPTIVARSIPELNNVFKEFEKWDLQIFAYYSDGTFCVSYRKAR